MKILKRVLLAALFTAFTIVLGLVPTITIPFIPTVPIVLQNMGVFLVGLILGRLGALSMLFLLGLAAIGLPVLSGGRGGFAVFLGPTSGYLLGYVIAAFLIGLIAEARQRKSYTPSFKSNIIASFVGLITIYAAGIPVLSLVSGMPMLQALLVNLVFIPGDIAKIIIASYIAKIFQQVYPLLPTPSHHALDTTAHQSRTNITIDMD